jgi:hypothetical protein
MDEWVFGMKHFLLFNLESILFIVLSLGGL